MRKGDKDTWERRSCDYRGRVWDNAFTEDASSHWTLGEERMDSSLEPCFKTLLPTLWYFVMAASGSLSRMQAQGIQTGRAGEGFQVGPCKETTVAEPGSGEARPLGTWPHQQLSGGCVFRPQYSRLAPPAGLSPNSHLQNFSFSGTSGAANSAPPDLY